MEREDLIIRDDQNRKMKKTPRHVLKEECDDCKQYLDTYLKGGNCIVLQEKNKYAIDAIIKLPDKRKRITHRETRSLPRIPK
jgi:hypothetical protein